MIYIDDFSLFSYAMPKTSYREHQRVVGNHMKIQTINHGQARWIHTKQIVCSQMNIQTLDPLQQDRLAPNSPNLLWATSMCLDTTQDMYDQVDMSGQQACLWPTRWLIDGGLSNKARLIRYNRKVVPNLDRCWREEKLWATRGEDVLEGYPSSQ